MNAGKMPELLRVIQCHNSSGYHSECGTEDDFAPGPDTRFDCCGEGEGVHDHSADRNGGGRIDIVELVRVIQFCNSGGYRVYRVQDTEEGCCPGL